MGRAMLRFIVFYILGTIGIYESAHGAGDKATGSIAVFKFIQETENADPEAGYSSLKQKQDYQFIDVGFCYTMGSICLGAKYLDATIASETTVVFNGSSTPSTSESETKLGGIGLKLGLSHEAFIAHYSFMLQKNMSVSNVQTFSTSTVEYNVDSASVIDVGYGFKVNKLRFGPMFSVIDYAVDSYTDSSNNTVEVDLKMNYLAPYFALWIDF